MTPEVGSNFIGGEWVAGSAGSLAIDDPATGEPFASQALADASDIDRAVAAARACHESGVLRAMRPVERGRMVRAMGDHLLANIDAIADLLTRESGKPLWESRIEIEGAARYFEYYGNQAETLEGRSIPLGASYLDFTVLEPLGVSAQIIPWNYPLEMAARSLAPALASGNACVVKTPELDPLSSAWLGAAAREAELPAGAVNILCGRGADAGAALAAHPGVDQIVFTGSVATGVSVATAAARNVVPCVLELGGKSAAIVWPDADLDALLESVRWGIFFNAGQVCSAMSRVVAHESIAGEIAERAGALAASLDVRAGAELPKFGANMGAMASAAQRDRAAKLCRAALDGSARAVAGGGSMARDGFFLQPTVLDRVAPGNPVAREEVFGPVLAIQTFRTDNEAIALANGTEYGLVAGVFTADVDRAMRAARDLRAGQVFVNEWYAGGVETPFGGFGKSGYGREKGREALLNYVATKNVAVAIREGRHG